MICRRKDGLLHCEQEGPLFFILRSFELGRSIWRKISLFQGRPNNFILLLVKSFSVTVAFVLSSHVHNEISKYFLLAICTPITAEVLLNTVVNLLLMAQRFPNMDTFVLFFYKKICSLSDCLLSLEYIEHSKQFHLMFLYCLLLFIQPSLS